MQTDATKGKPTLKERVGAILTICGIICGVIAFFSLFSEEDASDLIRNAEMSPKDYVHHQRIAQVYGITAAEYWRSIIEDNKPMADYIYQSASQNGSTKEIDNAISANFQVPTDDKNENKLLNKHRRLKTNYPNLVRRQGIFERFKDSMTWLGGMVLFLFFARKLGWKFKNTDYG